MTRLIGVLWIGCSIARAETASDLIKFLTYQTRRAETGQSMSLVSCGTPGPVDDLAATRALAKLGAEAITELEPSLAVIEGRGPVSSPGWIWLTRAFATIEGSSAQPRLRTMIRDPRFNGSRPELDAMIAFSSDLTSYVSSRHGLPGAFQAVDGHTAHACGQGTPEPRDGLDQFVYAWESNDRELFENTLGPHAKAALNSAMENRSWDEVRAALRPLVFRDADAIGYRFAGSGEWSAPRSLLEVANPDPDAPVNPALDTTFKTGSGRDCGRMVVRFDEVGIGANKSSYRVDNSNLVDLLRTISGCASD